VHQASAIRSQVKLLVLAAASARNLQRHTRMIFPFSFSGSLNNGPLSTIQQVAGQSPQFTKRPSSSRRSWLLAITIYSCTLFVSLDQQNQQPSSSVFLSQQTNEQYFQPQYTSETNRQLDVQRGHACSSVSQ
jgi:hypothetical protein